MKKRAGLTAYELPQAQPKGLTGPRSGSGSARGGHRKPEATPVKASGSTYNNLNELTGRSGSGAVPVRISGSVNEPASITVNSQSAQVVANPSGGDTCTAWANLSLGANLVAIQATDNGAGGPGFNPKSEIGRADLP